jgi:PAS domain S-box-containing protein
MQVNFQQVSVAIATNQCQKLLERIPHLAWLMTDETQIFAVNRRWCEYIGQYRETETSDGKPTWVFSEFLHTADLDRFAISWAEAQKARKLLELKLRLKNAAGAWEWFQVEAEPDFDESNQITWIATAVRLGSEAAVPMWEGLCPQHQSAQFLEALLDYASDGIVACDADGHLVLFNRTAQAFHGLPPQPIDPEEWANHYDLYDADGLKILTKSEIPLFQALEGKSVVDQEMMIKSKQGEARSLLASGSAIYSTTGEKLGAVVLMRDITGYKQAKLDRHRAEYHSERLSTALEVAKAGAWTWNLSNQQIFWTPEFEILFDYDPGSTQQTYSEWLERVHPDDRERAETTVQNTIDHKSSVYRCEYRIVDRHSQIRWIDAIGELHYDEQNNLKMSGLIYDITERKRTETALQASEELFRHTFEYTSMGFCHVALDGTMSRLNNKFCEIVGYSQAELSGTTFQAITEPADLAQDLALVEKLLNGSINEYTLEKRYVHKQGHHVWVCLTVSLVRENKVAGEIGVPQYFISAIQDITDRKKLELLNLKQTIELQRLNRSLILTQENLKERNQELDSFAYLVSHDLKAPLRAIANLSTWIEEDLDARIAQTSQQQFLLLRERIHRMDTLIDGLLHYSQVGRKALESEIVDVAQLLSEIIDSLSPPESFKIEILSSLPTLVTKRILLSQVFANLLSNAIKHHDQAEGRIEISAVNLGNCYQFSIADNGPGIPDGKDRERIFEIFQTLKPSDTKANTGIGLAVVKKIVEGEGGQIWLDNERIEGTCFSFTWFQQDVLGLPLNEF